MAIPVERIDAYRWRIPPDAKPGMQVPAIIFADDKLMEQIRHDLSLEQAANAAMLPGIVKAAYAMPDIHQGYGLPIGAVVATRPGTGVITPGGVGYDINCGVRLLRTELTRPEVLPRLKELVNGLFAAVPAGVGSHGKVRLTRESERRPLEQGARWAVEQGLGEPGDLETVEASGCIPGADPDAVSPKAYERGRDQLGTLGSGNHFLEIQVVDEIFEGTLAKNFGLFPEQVVVLIHSGSRGLGHQVCTDYLEVMQSAMKKYSISVSDRQLACVPLTSKEGESYLRAMAAAANFAFTNRQMITHWAREVFERIAGTGKLEIVYDVCHNIAKVEEHTVEGTRKRVLVHRKGATRAFPKGHPALAGKVREWGQPVLIPGSMGTHSYVLVGTAQAMAETFGSCCHGAGRAKSRTQAKRETTPEELMKEMKAKNISVLGETRAGLVEEKPDAYKDVGRVVDVVHNAGLAVKVARLKPLAVMKG